MAGWVAAPAVPLILLEFPHLISRDLKLVLSHLSILIESIASDGYSNVSIRG
jgi:hypothetical protein